jgi:hypothetical protein
MSFALRLELKFSLLHHLVCQGLFVASFGIFMLRIKRERKGQLFEECSYALQKCKYIHFIALSEDFIELLLQVNGLFELVERGSV